MPFTFLSHQAPVLPLKILRPAWFSGTALAIGSMAPDLEYFVRLGHYREIGHTLWGQFFFCLPITLLLALVVRRLVARPLALHLPDAASLHLRDYRVLGDRPADLRWGAVAALSALIGSFSHIIWDSFTHLTGWGALHVPALRILLFRVGEHGVYSALAFQHISTVLGAAAVLWMLSWIGRHRLLLKWYGVPAEEPEEHPTPESHARLWGATAAGVALGIVVGLGRSAIEHHWYFLDVATNVFFAAVTFGFLGLCAGCALSVRYLKRNDLACERP